MPQPDLGDVHVNALLTNVSIAYRNPQEHYIADRMFPFVPVDKQSDIYPVYTRGFMYADEGQRMIRAPGTRAPTTGWAVDNTNTYRCLNYAIGVEIPDELRQNADVPFDMDRDAVQLITALQAIRRERAFAADFIATGLWTGQADKAGTTDFVKWSDYGGSDPFTDLEDGLDAVEGASGMRPNRIAMGAITWRRLKHHPDFIDRIKGGATGGNPALVTRQLLAGLLEVDEILVGRASFRSSDEGASLTLARIIDDDLLMIYATPGPSLLMPAAGYTYYWRPLTGGGIEFVRRGRQDRERYDWVESHSYFDQVATSVVSGAFFSDAVD